jgi:predicted RecA/RadA family phage recombinase
MASNYLGVGDVIQITATGAFTQNTIYVGTDRCGVYLETGVTGDLAPIALEGIFTLTKAAAGGSAFTVLDKAYSTSTGLVSNAATGNVHLGHAVAAAVTGATAVQIKLSGGALSA